LHLSDKHKFDFNFKVEWLDDRGCWGFVSKNGKGGGTFYTFEDFFMMDDCPDAFCIVIGDIYQKPELMAGTGKQENNNGN